MKTDNIKKNYILNTILQVVQILVPLILTPYVARVLGVEQVGVYSYSLAMVTYFTLFAALGTNTYGQRQIAYTRDDKEQLTITFWNTFFFRLIISIFSLMLYFIYLFFSRELNIVNILLLLNIINVIFDISWFYQGIEIFKRIVYKNLFFKVISVVFIYIFVKTSSDLWIYVLIICTTTVVGNISTWARLNKYIGLPKQKIKPFNNIKDIILVFLPTIAIQVYTIMDKSMIGWITKSDYANGCYDRAESIARVALTVVTSIAAVVLPRVSNLFRDGDVEKAKEYVYKAYRFVWLLSIPIMFGLIVVAPSFMPLYLGEGYDDTVILLQIFSVIVVLVSLSYVTGLSYLVSTKQQNVYTIAVSIAAVVNIILNLFLIPKYSIVGAAIATITAEFVGCVIELMYCIIKGQLKPSLIFKPAWKYFLSGLLMFCITFIIKINITNMVLCFILIVSVGIVSYFVFLLILRDSLVLGEIRKIFKLLFKKKETTE